MPKVKNTYPDQIAVDASVAAETIGLKAPTLEKDRREGHLGVPYVKAGRRILYCLADLKAWLEEQKINPVKKGFQNDSI